MLARTTTQHPVEAPEPADLSDLEDMERAYSALTLRDRMRAEARGERDDDGPEPGTEERRAWLRERLEMSRPRPATAAGVARVEGMLADMRRRWK